MRLVTIYHLFRFFQGSILKSTWLKNAPAGTRGSANPSGWSNEEILIEYLNHFIHYTKACKENESLLIFDNHESHLSDRATDKARECGIVMLHYLLLQPLDQTVFRPLKTFYYQELDLWMRNNRRKTFSIYNIAEAPGKAFPKAFTTNNITKGLSWTGIFPMNSDIFHNNDFLCSKVENSTFDSTIFTRSDPNMNHSTSLNFSYN